MAKTVSGRGDFISNLITSDRKAAKTKDEMLYKKLSKQITADQSKRGLVRPAVLIDRSAKQRKLVN